MRLLAAAVAALFVLAPATEAAKKLAAVALDYALAGLTSVDEVFRVSASLVEEFD